MPSTKFLDRKNDLDVEKAITAMIVCPTLEDAVTVLKAQGTTTTVEHLRAWRDRTPEIRERYEVRRNELAPVVEGMLANDLLDNAKRIEAVIGLAVERTEELLRTGKVAEPSRVARDLSQVATQAVDKRLALQGRPTQITEHRDVGEIVRALQGMKVVQVVDSTAEELPQ